MGPYELCRSDCKLEVATWCIDGAWSVQSINIFIYVRTVLYSFIDEDVGTTHIQMGVLLI